ncbi:MAG: hypothetical protein WB762_01760 [Candidatus Sulfotelmatobacter sp.]
MQYKGASRSLPQIARELGVDGILEGSIERSANRVHMTVQLIYAPTDTHVWADSYNRDETQAYSLPEELSQTIAKEVRAATSPAPAPRYINPEAHDAYLRGRYIWFQFDAIHSLEYFQKAIQLQPDYAAAWAGMADAYAIRAVDNECPASEVAAKAEAAARKTVELDESLPEGHLALGAWYFFYAWDLPRAEAELKRVIELEGGPSEAHHLYSYLLLATSRREESLQEQKRATELDPLLRNWGLGFEYIDCGSSMPPSTIYGFAPRFCPAISGPASCCPTPIERRVWGRKRSRNSKKPIKSPAGPTPHKDSTAPSSAAAKRPPISGV